MAWGGPKPLIENNHNWKETIPSGTIETEMDEGPPKIRRDGNPGSAIVSFSQIMTKAETVLLDTYYVTTLNYGTTVITDTHPRTDLSFNFRLRRPTYTHLGADEFEASMELVIVP